MPASTPPPDEKGTGPDLSVPLNEAQIQTMRKTYQVPVEKLARRYEGGGHIFLVVFLLLLVIGAGVAALLLTGTLSI